MYRTGINWFMITLIDRTMPGEEYFVEVQLLLGIFARVIMFAIFFWMVRKSLGFV